MKKGYLFPCKNKNKTINRSEIFSEQLNNAILMQSVSIDFIIIVMF